MPESTIHWHEGLFLRPQHFQLLDRQISSRIAYERGLVSPYSYGVVQSKISYDDLENYKIRYEKLEVVMPDGALISFPDNSDLPTLNIKEAFAASPKGFIVYLALPIWRTQRANVLDSDEMEGVNVKARYRVAKEVEEVEDENSGLNPQAVQVRRLNAMFLLDDDDDSDVVKIPLLKVVHDTSREEPFPKQESTFVPPCLHLGASPTLREMVRDLFNQVSAVREQLANVVARGSDDATVSRLQMQQVLRLRSLNGFVAKMPALLESGDGMVKIPPLSIYLELRALLGELMALLPERESFDIVPYRHNDPYPSFQAVIALIRNYIHGAVTPDYIKLEFVDGDNGCKVAHLDSKHFAGKFTYFLGVKTNIDPSQLSEMVQDADQFQLMPASYMERAIRGVSLREERFPPLELPSDNGRYYFRLNTSQSRRIWEEIEREMEMVAQWSDEGISSVDLELTLYMTTS